MFVQWYNNTNVVLVDTLQYAQRNEGVLGEGSKVSYQVILKINITFNQRDCEVLKMQKSTISTLSFCRNEHMPGRFQKKNSKVAQDQTALIEVSKP